MFGYDPAGNLTSTVLPAANGWTERREYDRAGELTDVATTRGSPATTLAAYHLTLDRVGDPTAISTTRGTATRTDTYTYDEADRLTAVCYNTSTCDGAASGIGYGYDAVSNRTSQTRTGVAQPGATGYSYDAADQLRSSTAGTTTTTYGYDADGNLTTAGGRTISYDLLDEPLSSTSGGVSPSFSYDVDGNRLTAGSTSFAWDTAAPVPLLATQTAGGTTRGYAYDPNGDPLTLATGGKAYSYTHDWLGGISDLTDPAGTAQYAYTYEPYGGGAGAAPVPLTATAPANPLRYAGAYTDPTGDYYLRARQYDPTTGRFDGTDPATPALTTPTVSPYAYVEDQPTAQVDPTGECGLKAKLKSLRPHWGKSACEIEDEQRCTPNGRSVAATDADCAAASAENTVTSPEFATIFVSILTLPIVVETLGSVIEEINAIGGIAFCRQALAKILSRIGAALGGAGAEVEARGGTGSRGGSAGGGGALPMVTTRVGRWMSNSELTKMRQTGQVQYGTGGTSYVASPADREAYGSQAAPGTVYVEYDVPKGSIYPAGKPGWGQIPSPDSPTGRRYTKIGRPPAARVPASNITVVARK
jgi:RHS repeat-associated protein